MKNIPQALMLLALIGISYRSNSQVILNSGSFEPVVIVGANYTVPEGKHLIITHCSTAQIKINGTDIPVWVDEPRTIHIPIAQNNTVGAQFSSGRLIGYLVDADGFGVQIDGPEEEFTSEGGIEIYPNPTGDVASVFVDHQGTWDITVYDLNGQIVLESSVNTPVKTIDTNSLSSGTYIVSARAKRKLIGSSQLIVQ
ncbi:MAG: T9SS type A sorting domain-containing protein [Flavobacteriales bacterium]